VDDRAKLEVLIDVLDTFFGYGDDNAMVEMSQYAAFRKWKEVRSELSEHSTLGQGS
jgi:hypothetical protein